MNEMSLEYGLGGYAGPLLGAAGLVSYPNGAVVPADYNTLGLGYAGAYGYGPYGAALVGHPNGALVPAESAEIVASREASLAALAAGGDGRGPNANNFAAGADGLVAVGGTVVPADTAEVAAAKADFLATFNMMNMPGADK